VVLLQQVGAFARDFHWVELADSAAHQINDKDAVFLVTDRARVRVQANAAAGINKTVVVDASAWW
jgi:hypothetical protein